MRILIIHDDKSLAHAVRRELDETLYKIRHARNGDTGLEIALENDFDLVVLNWSPKKESPIDGMGVLTGLRAREKSTPVLVLAADDSVRNMALPADLGMDVCVMETLDLRDVTAKIKALIGVRRLKPDSHPGTGSGETVETEELLNHVNPDTGWLKHTKLII